MHHLGRTVIGFVAVAALLFSVVGCGDDIESARDFVAAKYSRATSLDQANDGRAYTAALAPAAVGSAIAAASQPLDNRRVGDRTYLQYRNDIITVAPHGTGSMILVDQYGNGYRRHQPTVSGFGWPSQPPGSEYRGQSGK
ncbi:DUF4247 domain-containing protein [Nocardia bhagyanarayanae]|uniref:Uncharacterized protein DUF4247 n=1 Tax=Nocardia bhagyanarayanae TaxID=1215925 RepID=A0A543FDZ6_9NOCA|nr:DUF4247 domain-containing protein [Nocardia bhagyanarayanae]TQM32109.1 uncharacterized protein DUF4247 [Nocardia bhagyanarayanae]